VVNPRSWNKIPGQFEVRTTIWNITASDVKDEASQENDSMELLG
jgi:hypothetical protein